MTNRCVRTVAAVIAFLLCSCLAFSQDTQQEQKKRKSASLDGTTGLFKTWDAETLRRGEANFSAGFDHYNRDPGQLVIKDVPASVAVGIIDRLEFFESTNVQRSIKTFNDRTYRLLPGQLPRPAQTLLGRTYFTNDAPFIDVPQANGRGDTLVGLKVNLFSELRGNRFAMAIAGFGGLPGQTGITGLNRGLSNGGYSGGYMFLFSKRAGRIAQLHLNLGANYVKSPEIGNVQLTRLQDEFIYRVGAGFPTTGTLQLIAELAGKTFFGKGAPVGLNPVSPIDVILGVKGYPTRWLSGGVGYQASLRHINEDPSNQIYAAGTNGFVAQVALGIRRNDPPVVTCACANPSIKQDDTTTIRANASDPDQDTLTYTWSSSGGKLSGTGDTATFDATGVAPGKYTVTSEVSDGHKHVVSCSTEITVLKRNLAPRISCETSSVTLTQGESTTLRVTGSDPNNDPLTYTWTVNGQTLAETGPSITFGTVGRQPGTYTVNVTASDGELTASCSMTVTVKELVKPNRPPTIEALTPSVDVASGGSVELRVQASDPDNDPLTITWTSTCGSVSGSGTSATFNASGLKAGRCTVTATADDGRGGKASCSMTVNVSERMSLVCAGKTRGGNFTPGGLHVDNCAKAMLDDVATRMQSDPQLYANIIGYTDSSRLETRRKNLGERRAKAVAAYLVKKGVDSSRLRITDGGISSPVGDNKTAAGRRMNRRVEIEFTVR